VVSDKRTWNQKPVSLDGRISSDGRLVWKTPESLLSAAVKSIGKIIIRVRHKMNIRFERDLRILSI